MIKKEKKKFRNPHRTNSDKGVYVIFPVNALGDHAYNDLILEGILKAQKKLGFTTMLYAPASMEEGVQMLELILNSMNHAEKGENLAIIAGNEYEQPPANGYKLRNYAMDLKTTYSSSKQTAQIFLCIPFSSICMAHLI